MRRYRHPFSVAYLDFDNFKFINDTLGHSVGDDLIRVVVETLNHELRKTDQAARLGGDEFAILMPETDGKIAPQVMERMCSKLLDSMKGNNWPVTFSIGLATFNKPPNSVDDMIKAADSLMYEAKNNGKNRVKSSTISPD
jgi:diguanylate cyclase (GGDEF)-like protein